MKFSSSSATLLGLAASAQAFPTLDLFKRQSAGGLTDVDILNYALTLEHLEGTFYRTGLQNFTQAQFLAAGYTNDDYVNLQQVMEDEQTHVDFLTAAIQAAGGTPVAECTYNFGFQTVQSFLATASVLEGVGQTAYLGAAGDIANKAYLAAAGSILTIEARHSTYLRGLNNQAPVAQAFDNALDPNEVYTLAAPFINTCPSSNPTLPVKAFPMLAVDTSSGGQGNMTVMAGGNVTLDTQGYSLQATGSSSKVKRNGFFSSGPVVERRQDSASMQAIYAAVIGPMGPVYTNVSEVAGSNGTKFSVQIPQGLNGQSYIVLTGCNETISDDTIAAGPAIVEISNPLPYNATIPMAVASSNATANCTTPGFSAISMMPVATPSSTSSSSSSSSASASALPQSTGGAASARVASYVSVTALAGLIAYMLAL